MDNASLHHAIVTSILARQRAPKVAELASRFNRSEREVRAGLRALAADHGVVLHPTSDEIWIAHPFSTVPTPFVVRARSCAWWGNCAWCSLGIAFLVGGSAAIETRIGALDEPVTIRTKRGRILDKNFVVHFPVPMRQAWDNVLYTCSVMLLFQDEAQVNAWCAERGVQKGDVRPIEQVWRFAAEWYARHADADWTKLSTHEARCLFEKHALTGPIWELPPEAKRF